MYNLILMHLRIPVMDGIEATKIIKGELHLKIPVVALTGESGENIQKQCKEIAFDAYFNKPMKRDQLQVVQEYTCYIHESQL
jgi:CheY-like chemotaxis protein